MTLLIRNSLLVIGGACVGAVLTDIFLEKKYQALADKEIAEYKEYVNRTKEYSCSCGKCDEENKNMTSIVADTSKLEKDLEYVEKINYSQFASAFNVEDRFPTDQAVLYSDGDRLVPKRTTEEEEAELESEEKKSARIDFKEPYIITKDEYDNECPHYDKLSIEYYEEDQIFSDENGDVIDNPLELFNGAEDHFGEGSDDKNFVYVRNDRFGIDYEIYRDSGSYQRKVLGIPE